MNENFSWVTEGVGKFVKSLGSTNSSFGKLKFKTSRRSIWFMIIPHIALELVSQLVWRVKKQRKPRTDEEKCIFMFWEKGNFAQAKILVARASTPRSSERISLKRELSRYE